MELNFIKVEDKDFNVVSMLILDMYERHLKRYFSENGDAFYKKNASPNELKLRAAKETYFFMIKEEDELVGLLEFDNKKITQFFIVDEYRGRGYGRMTVNWLKTFYKENKLGNEFYVLASPNAYLGFEKMGFEQVGEEKTDSIFVSKKMRISF
ncbi:MAG: GNAT family N-acetyltransferase [Bacteroidia bacterium]